MKMVELLAPQQKLGTESGVKGGSSKETGWLGICDGGVSDTLVNGGKRESEDTGVGDEYVTLVIYKRVG